MPSTQEFRRRIKSVNNTKQITKAMEMVASVKMQKAVRAITNARSYVQNSWNMLLNLANLALPDDHPLIKAKENGKTAIIFIASDRGLCGSYNADLFKKILAFVKEECQGSQTEFLGNCDIIAIGKKGAEFVSHNKIGKLVAAFDGFDNEFDLEDVIPISKLSNGEYLNGHYSRVVILYSYFLSSLRQIPVVRQILPLDKNHIDVPDLWSEQEEEFASAQYKFEPDINTVLEKLLRRIIRLQIYGAILSANAANHSASMVAMKNATDNAGNIITDLQLMYNSMRQNSITNEIAEISGAVEAMK